MPTRLSNRRVHPEPRLLNPAKAPWSAPRNYATTIKEEADALKAAARTGKPPVKVVGGRAFLQSPAIGAKVVRRTSATPNCFNAIGAHLCDIYSQIVANFKVNSQQLVSKIFCIKLDVDDEHT